MEGQKNTNPLIKSLFSSWLLLSFINQTIIAISFILMFISVITIEIMNDSFIYATILAFIIAIANLIYYILRKNVSSDITSNLLKGYDEINQLPINKKILFTLIVGILTWSSFAQIAWIGTLIVKNQEFIDPYWLSIFFEELSRLAGIFGLIGAIIVSGVLPVVEKKEEN